MKECALQSTVRWIADLFKMGLVRSSYIPSKDFRILREFTRYRYKLTNTKSSEKNRFTNALTVDNCKLDMVFSDIFGKSSQSIIDVILNNDNFSDDDIISRLHKNCKPRISRHIIKTSHIFNQQKSINILKIQKQKKPQTETFKFITGDQYGI